MLSCGDIMREYEALLIVDAEKESSLKQVTSDIIRSVTKAKGKVNKEENWGKQKLPYSIKKKREGIYLKLGFSAEPSEIAGLKNNYKLNQDILRATITVKK